MKNRLLGVMLALIMAVIMIPTIAVADETQNIKLGDVSTDQSGQNWEWSATSKTLTLSGVSISVSEGDAISLPDDATIVLADDTTNTINNTGEGNSILGGKHLTIKGASNARTGELSITHGNNGGHAIMTEQAANGESSGLSIADCELTISGGKNGIRVGDGDSGVSRAYLSIENSDITIENVGEIGIRLEQTATNGTTNVNIEGSKLDVSAAGNDAMRLKSNNNSELLIEESDVTCKYSGESQERDGIRFESYKKDNNRTVNITIKDSSVYTEGGHGTRVATDTIKMQIEDSVFSLRSDAGGTEGLHLNAENQTVSVKESVVFAKANTPYYGSGAGGDPTNSWELVNSALFGRTDANVGTTLVWNKSSILSQSWQVPDGNSLHIEAEKSLTINAGKKLTFGTGPNAKTGGENTLILKGGTLTLNGGSVGALTYESGTIITTQALGENISLTTQAETTTIMKGTDSYKLTQEDLAKLILVKVVGTNNSENNSDVTGKYALYLDENNNQIVQKECVSVTFDSNDGSGKTQVQKVPKNEATALNPNTFIRENYVFTGWTNDANGASNDTAYTDRATVTLSADTTLYAKWVPAMVKFLPGEGGIGVMPGAILDDNTLTFPACGFTAPAGKEFAVWKITKPAGYDKVYNVGDTETFNLSETIEEAAPIEVTAQWKDKPQQPDPDPVDPVTPVSPLPSITPYSGGSSSSGNTYSWYFNPTPSPVPVPVDIVLPKTGDMTIWQSILHFFGII